MYSCVFNHCPPSFPKALSKKTFGKSFSFSSFPVSSSLVSATTTAKATRTVEVQYV